MDQEEFVKEDIRRERRERHRLILGVAVAVITLVLSALIGSLLVWHLYVDTPFDVTAFEREHEAQTLTQGRIIENQQIIVRNQQILMQQLIGKHCVKDDFGTKP